MSNLEKIYQSILDGDMSETQEQVQAAIDAELPGEPCIAEPLRSQRPGGFTDICVLAAHGAWRSEHDWRHFQ